MHGSVRSPDRSVKCRHLLYSYHTVRVSLSSHGHTWEIARYNCVPRFKQYPDAEQHPGIVVCRVDAPLYFANAQFIREVSFHDLIWSISFFCMFVTWSLIWISFSCSNHLVRNSISMKRLFPVDREITFSTLSWTYHPMEISTQLLYAALKNYWLTTRRGI